VRIDALTDAQVLRYFESRLPGGLRRSGSGMMAKCLWHDDRHASLSISIPKKAWNCHGGCKIGGGMIDFEMRFSSCDKETALTRIAEVVGESRLNLGQQPEAIYPYTDVFGKLIFQVVRYPGKKFTQRQPDGKGGWIYQTKDLKMVPYRLQELVMTKNSIWVEGEKDADNLTKALAGVIDASKPNESVAVSTSPRGAGKWQDDFAYYLKGKHVLIVPDNDDAGRQHAQRIAASCYGIASGIKLLELPDLPVKGDVSDFLEKHTIQEFLQLAKQCPPWKPSVETSSLFMSVSQFKSKALDHIDWLVEGLVQHGANGMFVSHPKSGKSMCVVDLALALASGQKWMDFYIPRRVKVALVSREDHYGLTQWREEKLAKHRNLTDEELDGWLYINAKGLKPKVMLDYLDDVAMLIADLKRQESEFLILDVMRVLHSSEENDNTEMQKIIDTLNKIQDEAKVSICLVHHENRSNSEFRLTERVRGASAIAGWVEWICGVRVVEEEDWTREFSCELKAAPAPDKFYFRILDTADGNIELAKIDGYVPPLKSRRKQDSSSRKESEEF
jgi:hypothetical protein